MQAKAAVLGGGGVQEPPLFKPETDEEWVEVPGGRPASVNVRIIRFRGVADVPPVVL